MAKLPLSQTLVLASSSKARDRILRKLDLPFTVILPKLDEEAAKAEAKGATPPELAAHLARAKAASVNEIHPGWLVLGCDQVCEADGEILSKPGTSDKAFAQLTRLSGKTHRQHSAAALYHHGECIWQTVETAELTMRELDPEEIAAYVALDNPLEACGSYRFEAHGRHLFRRVVGTDDVIEGLPALEFLNALYDRGFLKLSLGN